MLTTSEGNNKSQWVPNPPQLDGNFSETGQVTDVIDGDTIDVLIDGTEYRVRYSKHTAPTPNRTTSWKI